MHKRIGFIGCGRLGQALLRGWLSRGAVLPDHVVLAAKSSAEATATDFGVRFGSVQDVIDQIDALINTPRQQIHKPWINGKDYYFIFQEEHCRGIEKTMIESNLKHAWSDLPQEKNLCAPA